MLRKFIYFVLGLLLGVVLGLIVIGVLASALPNFPASLILLLMFASALVFAIAGVMLASRMNNRDEQLAQLPATAPSDGYVAAYIYAIATLCYVFVGFVSFAIFLMIPQSTEYLIIEFVTNNKNIPFLLAGNMLLYILLSNAGIWYVVHVKHLRPSHSPIRIAWWFVLLALVPVAGDWRALLAFVTQNLPVAIVSIGIIGSAAVLAVKYILRRAQKGIAQSTSSDTQ
jgi:hypothetical protein